MDVRHGFQVGFERSEQFVLQLHMKIVGQRVPEFSLDFRIRLARGAAEEAMKHLFRCDRIAVTRQRLRMRAA